MLLLAVDTSGKHGRIALAQCGPGNACDLIEAFPLTGGMFSALLIPEIAQLLTKHGFTKTDISAFVVVSGPGSFTGLRIGLAAIKALAEVLAKPIAAVSLLEAMAIAGRSQGKISSVLDAGRGEVYVGEYDTGPGGTRMLGERMLSRGEWLDTAGNATVVTQDGSVAEAARAKGLRVIQVEATLGDGIVQLGWKKLSGGETVSADALEANYIRRSDAEIFAKSRS